MIQVMKGDVDLASLGDFARVSTSSTIAARLIDMINGDQLAVGTTLPPERDLANTLGVSRSTLREAIHELTLKGYISRRQGSGSTITAPPPTSNMLLSALSEAEREIREVVDYRLIFEPHIAAVAAERAIESDILRLSGLVDYDPSASTEEESFILDNHFHQAVADATQNRLIMTLCSASSEWIADFRRRSHSSVENRTASLAGHREILAAIRARDADRAAAAMSDHIRTVGYLD
jgi:GntR family transcriptional repressor for pyruvate dehydrogenase complex